MTETRLAELERRIDLLIDAATNAAEHVKATPRGSVTNALAQASLAHMLDRLRDARTEIAASIR